MADDRHPAVASIMQFFETDDLSEDLQTVAIPCWELANEMADYLPSNPELTAGLRKLLEAKDCFVRARQLEQRGKAPEDGEGGQ